jgi:threonine/homoserine/homoserine lactone efflux protein
MTYTQNLWVFFVLLFGIIVLPGMDMFFVLTNSLTGGKARGLAATAGVMLSSVYYSIFGAFFVGAISKLAPSLITIILFAGAAYMAWIGFTLLKSSIFVDDIGKANARSMWSAVRQGFVSSILNPKAYVFILATYPVFIQRSFGPIWQQAIVLCILALFTQLIIYGGLVFAATKSRDLMISNPTATIWIGRVAGLMFMSVAVLTVWHALSH